MTEPNSIDIQVSDRIGHVSGLLLVPAGAWAMLALAHGAGAGMRHPFMAEVADALAGRGIASLRYQFPYMEQGAGRTRRPCSRPRRAAAEMARRVHWILPGRRQVRAAGMTSNAMACRPLEG
jgi:predicted alpha/beta-hydrolase family hydrolase